MCRQLLRPHVPATCHMLLPSTWSPPQTTWAVVVIVARGAGVRLLFFYHVSCHVGYAKRGGPARGRSMPPFHAAPPSLRLWLLTPPPPTAAALPEKTETKTSLLDVACRMRMEASMLKVQ